MASKTNLVVWDYDWSMIDTNSDTFVVQQLRPELMDCFRDPCASWTALMDSQMGRLFERGVGRDELVSCVAAVPAHAGCLGAIRLCGEAFGDDGQGTSVVQMILSDANTVFIEAFLERQALRGLFREVITNPAEFDAEGRLRVSPYHSGAPHGCPLCPSNLCKGAVLERVRTALAPDRVVYVGDGGGDFCPVCDLGPGDAVLCRAPPSPPLDSFGLHRRIRQSREKPAEGGAQLSTRRGQRAEVTAAVHLWHTGDDVMAMMSKLLTE